MHRIWVVALSLSIEMHKCLWSLALILFIFSLWSLHLLWDCTVVRSNKNTITTFCWNFHEPLGESHELFRDVILSKCKVCNFACLKLSKLHKHVRIWHRSVCVYIYIYKFIEKGHENIPFIFDWNILMTPTNSFEWIWNYYSCSMTTAGLTYKLVNTIRYIMCFVISWYIFFFPLRIEKKIE